VVEVPVSEEEVARPGERRRSSARIEPEARRLDAEPGLLAGDRAPLDRELAAPEAGARLAVARASGRRQISW
jgi:hypothetical protein